MTTDNSERIEAAESLARKFHEAYERLAPQFDYVTRDDTRTFDPESANGRLMIAVCAEMSEHFGESAPEQKEGNVATIYAEGRWIHARCFLCEWSGVRWRAKKGSRLPNAKAILQHALRDHLLAAHVGKLNPDPACQQCEMEKTDGEQIGLRHHECTDAPVLPSSVETNAERCTCAAPDEQLVAINPECPIHANEGGDAAVFELQRKSRREMDDVQRGGTAHPADASPQEPTCAPEKRCACGRTDEGHAVALLSPYNEGCPICGGTPGLCYGGMTHVALARSSVESSVLPSKSESE